MSLGSAGSHLGLQLLGCTPDRRRNRAGGRIDAARDQVADPEHGLVLGDEQGVVAGHRLQGTGCRTGARARFGIDRRQRRGQALRECRRVAGAEVAAAAVDSGMPQVVDVLGRSTRPGIGPIGRALADVVVTAAGCRQVVWPVGQQAADAHADRVGRHVLVRRIVSAARPDIVGADVGRVAVDRRGTVAERGRSKVGLVVVHRHVGQGVGNAGRGDGGLAFPRSADGVVRRGRARRRRARSDVGP